MIANVGSDCAKFASNTYSCEISVSCFENALKFSSQIMTKPWMLATGSSQILSPEAMANIMAHLKTGGSNIRQALGGEKNNSALEESTKKENHAVNANVEMLGSIQASISPAVNGDPEQEASAKKDVALGMNFWGDSAVTRLFNSEDSGRGVAGASRATSADAETKKVSQEFVGADHNIFSVMHDRLISLHKRGMIKSR